MFIMLPLSMIVMANGLQDASAYYGKWFTPYFLASKLLTLTSFLGLWFMHRWGVYLYVALYIVGQTSGYFLGMPITLLGMVVPIVIIGMFAIYFRRMR